MANLRRVKGKGSKSKGAGRGRQEPKEPLRDGTRVHEPSTGRDGEILEHACQYAHPQAAPVYHYLVRWDDGQVQAIGEAALAGHGVDVVDD